MTSQLPQLCQRSLSVHASGCSKAWRQSLHPITSALACALLTAVVLVLLTKVLTQGFCNAYQDGLHP